jgi:hypothetical protein
MHETPPCKNFIQKTFVLNGGLQDRCQRKNERGSNLPSSLSAEKFADCRPHPPRVRAFPINTAATRAAAEFLLRLAHRSRNFGGENFRPARRL